MKDFHQWLAEKGIDLSERGARTALSANYPSLYHGKRQNPPNDWAPTKASVPVDIKNGLGKEKPCDEFGSDTESQCGSEESPKNGGPNVSDKSENPYKSFYATDNMKKKMHKGSKPWMVTNKSPKK